MFNKNIIKDKKGQTNTTHIILLSMMIVIMGFGMLTIGNYLYFSIATNADAGTKTIFVGSAASGVANFSNTTFNISNGELFNITNGSAVYRFEFNTTGNPNTNFVQTANAIRINVSILDGLGYNIVNRSAINLTAAINANATLAPLLTATNNAGLITIALDQNGVAGNTWTLAENVYNASITSQPSGGVDPVTGQASQNTLNNYASIVFPLFGLALMVLGFGVIFITLRKSFGSQEER